LYSLADKEQWRDFVEDAFVEFQERYQRVMYEQEVGKKQTNTNTHTHTHTLSLSLFVGLWQVRRRIVFLMNMFIRLIQRPSLSESRKKILSLVLKQMGGQFLKEDEFERVMLMRPVKEVNIHKTGTVLLEKVKQKI